MTSSSKQNKQNRKAFTENAELYKFVMNKIMTTHK